MTERMAAEDQACDAARTAAIAEQKAVEAAKQLTASSEKRKRNADMVALDRGRRAAIQASLTHSLAQRQSIERAAAVDLATTAADQRIAAHAQVLMDQHWPTPAHDSAVDTECKFDMAGGSIVDGTLPSPPAPCARRNRTPARRGKRFIRGAAAIAGFALFVLAAGGAPPDWFSRDAAVPTTPTHTAVTTTADAQPVLRYSFELSSLTRVAGN